MNTCKLFANFGSSDQTVSDFEENFPSILKKVHETKLSNFKTNLILPLKIVFEKNEKFLTNFGESILNDKKWVFLKCYYIIKI